MAIRLPGRPFARMAHPGGFVERIGGLLAGGNPFVDFGFGLLGASAPRPGGVSFGEALAQAQQFAQSRQMDAMRNQAIREQLAEMQRQRQAGSALNELIASLSQPEAEAMLTPEQARILQLTAQTAPSSALQILAQRSGLLEPEPKGLEAKLATVQAAIGRPLTEQEVLSLAGSGGTVINVGTDKASEPIPISELANIRTATGEPLPVGATYQDAIQAGARVFSAQERQRQQQLEGALDVLAELKSLAIGEGGVFTGIPRNVAGRYARAVQFAITDLLGTEGATRRALYRDMSRGTIAPLVRALGESGALSEGDVERALSLLPDSGGLLPESGRLAEDKLRELENILRKAQRNVGADTGGGAVDIGGWKIRELP